MFRSAALLLGISLVARSQTPIENTGKPIHLAFECTEADMQASGLACPEDEPCPVYLELANVEGVGTKLFLAGNLHTPTTTMYSILLATADDGKTWTEPHPRIRSAGLDQIQFIDFQNGWISGANLQGAPRDPFLLLTTDGGMTWHQRPIYEDSRLGAIEHFWFDSPQDGTMLVDARLESNVHELYETRTGGESWSLVRASADPIPFPRKSKSGPAVWRVRPDAPTKSNVIEKSDGQRWQKVASFLVQVGSCKQ